MKQMLFTLIFIAVLTAQSFSCGVFGSISGVAAKQTDAGYHGIYGARVTLAENGAVVGTAMTNPFGMYAFPHVPACGNLYTVSIEKKGVTFIEPVEYVSLPVPDQGYDIEVDFISN